MVKPKKNDAAGAAEGNPGAGSQGPESEVVNDIILELVKIEGVRCWRSNVGMAYPYGPIQEIIRKLRARLFSTIQEVLPWILRVRPITFGVVGQGDITGVARGWRLEVEAKTEVGRQSEQQKKFEAMIRQMGGIYILARSGAEARGILERELEGRGKLLDNDSKLADREGEIGFWHDYSDWLLTKFAPEQFRDQGYEEPPEEPLAAFLDACDCGEWERKRGTWTP